LKTLPIASRPTSGVLKGKSMRRKLGAIAIIFAILLRVQAHAQAHAEFTTIILEREGKTDRFISPVIISLSQAEGDWYKEHFFGGPIPDLIQVSVVSNATLKKISEIRALQIIMDRPISKTGPIMLPTLRIIAGAGHAYKQMLISAANNTAIIEEIKKYVATYPDLVGQLSELEPRTVPAE
jgi:hypothetical protein